MSATTGETDTPHEVVLRRGQASDLQHILEVLAGAHGPGPQWAPDYWRWKHDENAAGTSPVWVAEVNGRVVGVRAFMRWTCDHGRTVWPCARAVDVAVDADWRRRGIFTQLTQRITEDVRHEGAALLFSTPNAQSTPGHLKMGWSTLGRPTLWVRPLRPVRLLRSVLGASVPPLRESRPSAEASDIEALLDRAANTGFLRDVVQDDARWSTHRTADYLRWRYAAIPGYDYHARWELQDGEGAAVIFRLGGTLRRRALLLCELLITPTPFGIRTGRAVLQRVLRETDAAYAMAVAVRRTPERRVLARSGFVPLPRRGPLLTVRVLDETMPPAQELRHWRLSLGDVEVL